MSLQAILDLARVKLSIKKDKQKLGVYLPKDGTTESVDSYILRGDPRVVLKALAQCMVDEGIPTAPLTRFDLLSYGLKNATDEEVTEYRTSELEPLEYATSDAVAFIEESENPSELDDCVIISNTKNKFLLKAIQSTLGRGNIDEEEDKARLLLGQTATTKHVAEKIKTLFEQRVEKIENEVPEEEDTCPPPKVGPTYCESAKVNLEQGDAVSDGSCENWINRHIKMDFNKLARNDSTGDFYLHKWLETKCFSTGGQKKFFSKVPRTVPVKDWATKITELLRNEGVDVGRNETDIAGLWAIRKYNGQVNVVGSGDNKRVCRKN